MRHLIAAVQRNDSLTALNISNCGLNLSGIADLGNALKNNSKIRRFRIDLNDLPEEIFLHITAETDANALLVSLRTNPQSVDTGTLSAKVFLYLIK